MMMMGAEDGGSCGSDDDGNEDDVGNGGDGVGNKDDIVAGDGEYDNDCTFLPLRYLSIFQSLPTYGVHYYEVKVSSCYYSNPY